MSIIISRCVQLKLTFFEKKSDLGCLVIGSLNSANKSPEDLPTHIEYKEGLVLCLETILNLPLPPAVVR